MFGRDYHSSFEIMQKNRTTLEYYSTNKCVGNSIIYTSFPNISALELLRKQHIKYVRWNMCTTTAASGKCCLFNVFLSGVPKWIYFHMCFLLPPHLPAAHVFMCLCLCVCGVCNASRRNWTENTWPPIIIGISFAPLLRCSELSWAAASWRCSARVLSFCVCVTRKLRPSIEIKKHTMPGCMWASRRSFDRWHCRLLLFQYSVITAADSHDSRFTVSWTDTHTHPYMHSHLHTVSVSRRCAILCASFTFWLWRCDAFAFYRRSGALYRLWGYAWRGLVSSISKTDSIPFE